MRPYHSPTLTDFWVEPTDPLISQYMTQRPRIGRFLSAFSQVDLVSTRYSLHRQPPHVSCRMKTRTRHKQTNIRLPGHIRQYLRVWRRLACNFACPTSSSVELTLVLFLILLVVSLPAAAVLHLLTDFWKHVTLSGTGWQDSPDRNPSLAPLTPCWHRGGGATGPAAGSLPWQPNEYPCSARVKHVADSPATNNGGG